MNVPGVADVLFTGVQQKLLALCFGNPDRTFYTNELIRLIGAGNGPVQRELKRMGEAGLLSISKIGNQKHYQANQASPVFAELSGLIRKTFGLADVVRQALLPVANQLEAAFIYGSVAKGNPQPHSDIDLMIISDSLAYADLFPMLTEPEAQLGRPINPTVYSRTEWQQRMYEGNTFVVRVLEQPKIFLIGGADDLGESLQPAEDR